MKVSEYTSSHGTFCVQYIGEKFLITKRDLYSTTYMFLHSDSSVMKPVEDHLTLMWTEKVLHAKEFENQKDAEKYLLWVLGPYYNLQPKTYYGDPKLREKAKLVTDSATAEEPEIGEPEIKEPSNLALFVFVLALVFQSIFKVIILKSLMLE